MSLTGHSPIDRRYNAALKELTLVESATIASMDFSVADNTTVQRSQPEMIVKIFLRYLKP